jgi:hypothetical protein
MAATQLNAQSDEDLIRHSINNYFNGTAYNHLAQIEAAFHPEAELFLENKAGELVIFTAAEYIALFEKNEPGKFGGRYSKILTVDIEGNLAQVKAEILMPKRKRCFIDVFLMRKNKEGQWQIISKAANSKPMEG